MHYQLQHKNSTGANEGKLPIEFITICTLAFIGSISATAYFARSMCCDMKMPGGWKMSMMWMPMPGQTYFFSALGFLLMWLAMMVAMMLPSALPMFIKTRRKSMSLGLMACGYFASWLVAGLGIYILGMVFMMLAMQSEVVSRAVPFLSAAVLIGAGIVQLTRWKKIHLLRCRSQYGCAVLCPQLETGFGLGCKQGIECCVCCVPPMMMQLALGIMNPAAMITIAIIIASEKMFPSPGIISRMVGIAAILGGSMLVITSYII